MSKADKKFRAGRKREKKINKREIDMQMHSQEDILVTGGGGYLGGAIVERLIKKGHNVTSFSRNHYKDLDLMNVKQVLGDLNDRKAVEHVVEGKDIVYHVAAKAGVWGKFENYYQTNVIGTQNILAACKKCAINRLIYTSSPSVVFNSKDMEGVDESTPYPDKFPTAYTETKAIAEKEVVSASKNGLKTIILRPHLIWGPKDPHFVPRILARAKQLVKVGAEDKLVDTIYIDNAADAHILAAESLAEKPQLSGKIYFITNDEPKPLWYIINGILEAGGYAAVTKSLPHNVVRTMGALLEFTYNFLNLKGEPRMTRFVADELGKAHWFDISAAKRDFNYTPKVSIIEGMELLRTWLNEKYSD